MFPPFFVLPPFPEAFAIGRLLTSPFRWRKWTRPKPPRRPLGLESTLFRNRGRPAKQLNFPPSLPFFSSPEQEVVPRRRRPEGGRTSARRGSPPWRGPSPRSCPLLVRRLSNGTREDRGTPICGYPPRSRGFNLYSQANIPNPSRAGPRPIAHGLSGPPGASESGAGPPPVDHPADNRTVTPAPLGIRSGRAIPVPPRKQLPPARMV